VSHKSLKQLNANLRNCSYAVTVWISVQGRV